MKIKKTKRYKASGVKPFFHGSLIFGDHVIDGCFSSSFNGKTKAEVIKACKKKFKQLIDSFYIEVEEFYK